MERDLPQEFATEPFTRWAGLYDAIYDRKGKDYELEGERLVALVQTHLETAPAVRRRWLDAACGTGRHLSALSKSRPGRALRSGWGTQPGFRESSEARCEGGSGASVGERNAPCEFVLHGLDGNPAMLAVARARNPEAHLVLGDLRAPPYLRDEAASFDVVSCLFASIGYLPTPEVAALAIARLARLLRPGGVLALEPPVSPERLRSPETTSLRFEHEGEAVERITSATVDGDRLHVRFDLRVGCASWTEIHRILLLPEEFYATAMERAGLRVSRDSDGLNGAGLLLGSCGGRG